MRAPAKYLLMRPLSRLVDALRDPPKAGLRVLLYHSVGTALPDDPHGIGIDECSFKRHVDHLSSREAGYAFCPFAAPPADSLGLAWTFDDGFKDVLSKAAPLLAAKNIPFTVFATADFIRQGSPLYLDEAELKELARLPGVSIGSHAKTHRLLTSLGPRELDEELRSSKRYLEDLLGRPVESLSYPNGAVDRRVRDAARAAGYRLGGSSRYGLNVEGRDPLLLCRTEIVAWDSVGDLELKAGGAWDWFGWRHPDPA
ncbi:MAG TPA: hypothetical protein DCM05_02740 [Elusimicrobia bacterium]|nr:hypothetical protein [Elusimicrobiota bacterium]